MHARVLAITIGVAALPCTAGPLDWPMLLHDTRQTATSQLKGNIKVPRLAWSYDLGLGRPDFVRDETRTVAVSLDLNEDGKSESIRCAYGSRTFDVIDGATGRTLWSAATNQPIYEQH